MMPQESFNQLSASDQPSQPDGALGGQTHAAGQSRDAGYIPVIEETFTVGKRVVETGQVRLVKTVHQDQQAISIPLVAEQIMVERVMINELVDVPPVTRQEGDTTIYPVLAEEYVIVKRIRVIEEIRVTKRQLHTTENQVVSLIREEVSVERTAVDKQNERSDSRSESSPGESSL